jgi:hypothetical protein
MIDMTTSRLLHTFYDTGFLRQVTAKVSPCVCIILIFLLHCIGVGTGRLWRGFCSLIATELAGKRQPKEHTSHGTYRMLAWLMVARPDVIALITAMGKGTKI